jgi:D-sedoheptulose 7-phosphate isomerase
MNKAWAQPPFDRYVASLTGALTSVQCEIASAPSRPDRGVDHAIALIRRTMSADGAVWLCGNGGSGTIADHIACDMVKMRGWRAFADQSALTTTFANDEAYGRAFDAQLAVQARPMDVVIGLSCSGESENVINAMADKRHVHITLSGFKADNRLRNKFDANVEFYVPSLNYGEVQIAHLAILHAMIDLAGAP